MATETEIKLLVAPERAAAIDAALRRLPGSRRTTLDAHYHDTRDGHLARHGLALRLRRAGRRWEQTLKAGGASPVEREEHDVARPGHWVGDAIPPLDVALHQGTPAGARLAAALADGAAADTALRPIYRIRVVRRSAFVVYAGAQIEIAFDLGEISAGTRTLRVCELEYELKGGDPVALVTLAQQAVRAHGALLSIVSKAERGDRLARAEATRPRAHKATPPPLDRSMSGGAVLQAALQACLLQVLGNASEVASGHWDAETVHQWRVGLRRLRTAVRELGPLVDGFDAAWEPVLTAAFRALGVFRDQHTSAGAYVPRLAAAGSPAPALASTGAAADAPDAIVRDAALQCALLDALGAVLALPRDRASPVAPRAGIDAALAALRGRLKRDARAYAQMDPPAQHAVRKRLKRLRYLAELVRSLYPAPKVERLLAALEPAQEALGERSDLGLAIDLARSRAQAGDGPAWFNVGWLTAQLAPNAKRCRKALRRAVQARPFW